MKNILFFFSVEDCKRRWRNIKDTYFRNRKKRKLGTGSASSEKPMKWALYDRLSFLDKVKHERESKNTLAEELVEEHQEETSVYSHHETDDYAIDLAGESSLDDSDLNSTPSTSRRTLGTVKFNKTLDKDHQESLTSGSRSSTPFQTNVSKTKPRVPKPNTTAQYEERAQKRMELLEAIHNKKKSEPDDVDLFMQSISLTVKKFPPAQINEAKLGILKLVSDLELKLATQHLSQQTTTQSSQSTSSAEENVGLNSHFYGNSQYQQNEPLHQTSAASQTTVGNSQYHQKEPLHPTATATRTTTSSYFQNFNPENQNSPFLNASRLDSENGLRYHQL